MIEDVLFARLARTYAPPRYALLRQVPDSVGFKMRTCDALAMGVQPSVGLHLHGFEIKSTRGDLQRELRTDGWKSDPILRFCDRWWLVVPDRRILDGLDIPDTWGILVAGPNVTRQLRPAPYLDALPMSRMFLAAILRRAAAQLGVATPAPSP